MAGTLWPEFPDAQAFSSLRSALARMDHLTRTAALISPSDLGLAEAVSVDFRDATALAHRILDSPDSLTAKDLGSETVITLSSELLPGWYDNWAIERAECWRQLRLDALEALADQLRAMGRLRGAGEAALAAVNAEPLRETARCALIGIHLARGNQAEALREFSRFQYLLHSELGLEPTTHMVDMVRDLRRE